MANPSGSKLNILPWYEFTDDAIKFLWAGNSAVTCKLCLKLRRMHTLHTQGLPLACPPPPAPKPSAHDQKAILGFASSRVTLIPSKKIPEKAG